MRLSMTLAAICLCLCVTSCASSSPPSPLPQAVLDAERRVEARLERPAPPSRLLLCQDGSGPQRIAGQWECPPPATWLRALESGSPLEQQAALIEALRNETALRFELRDWPRRDGNGTAP